VVDGVLMEIRGLLLVLVVQVVGEIEQILVLGGKEQALPELQAKVIVVEMPLIV